MTVLHGHRIARVNYPELLNIALTLYLTFNIINAFGWINTPLQKSVMLFSVIRVFFMCQMRPVQPGICQSGQPPRILWRRIQIWYKHLRCPRAVDHLFSVPYVSLLPPLKRTSQKLAIARSGVCPCGHTSNNCDDLQDSLGEVSEDKTCRRAISANRDHPTPLDPFFLNHHAFLPL